MEWKIERDYFYNELYQELGLDGIQEAGFFYDTDPSNYDIDKSLNLLCTPLHAVVEKLTTAINPCILLNTGAYCPIHEGHIEMMEEARKAVERKGFEVLAGYLSPGHDEYIFSKIKDNPIHAYHRIALIHEKIKDKGWLFVDPWEAVFCKVAVNFTDVIYRLQLYIEKHTGKKIPVFYVCGSDNARFSMTFIKKGNCVVVKRPSYEHTFTHYAEKLKNHLHIIFCEGNNHNSSTLERITYNYTIPEKSLDLRVENVEKEEAIIQLLGTYFLQIKTYPVSKQKEIFKTFTHPIINLDSLMTSRYNFHISRNYDLFGIHKLGYTQRPGYASLQEQIKAIPYDSYFLFDDDIHSGETMRITRKLLEDHGLGISGYLTFNTCSDKNTETLDCRDFIIGNENNGLIVQLSNGISTRAPYVYPYVCPYVRGSITQPMKFSMDVWKVNMHNYKDTTIRLRDLPFLDLFRYIGFSEDTTIYDICKWHYDILLEIVGGQIE